MYPPVCKTVPIELSTAMLRAVRDNPLTSMEDKDAMNTRIGWLICAWDVLLDAAPAVRANSLPECDHEWVDARNPVVKSGELCAKCFSVRAGNAASPLPAPMEPK